MKMEAIYSSENFGRTLHNEVGYFANYLVSSNINILSHTVTCEVQKAI
jgi:hypothetical protein